MAETGYRGLASRHDRTDFAAEQPLSVHRFRAWGAVGKGLQFGCGSLGGLAVAVIALGAAGASLERALWESAIWLVFAAAGMIGAGVAFVTGVRVFTRLPSAVAVYRTGLGWATGGTERRIPWSEIARVERNVQTFVVAGRPKQVDSVRIDFADGNHVLIWAETLSDYPTFADSVVYHNNHRLGTGVNPAGNERHLTTRRCWHCGQAVEVLVGDVAVVVHCPGCNTSLGIL